MATFDLSRVKMWLRFIHVLLYLTQPLKENPRLMVTLLLPIDSFVLHRRSYI